MSENKKKSEKENLLTGFLHALQFLTEILFFYGTGVLLYGFWNGITGGYLALFAGMVISGSLLLRLLVQIFERNHEETEHSRWTGWILEGAVYFLCAVQMNVQAGAAVLAGCAVILLLRKFTKGNMHDVVLRVCGAGFFLMTVWISLQMFQKNIMTPADVILMITGSLLFCLDDVRPSVIREGKSGFSWKKQILPIVLATGRDSFLTASMACLTPLFYQILSQTSEIHQTAGYRNLVICIGIALLFDLILYFREKKQNADLYASVVTRAMAAGITLVCYSIFLIHISAIIGLIVLLAWIALPAGIFLLKESGHRNSFTLKLFIFLLSWIGLFLVMMTSFQVYDGIYVDYSVVLMAYLLYTAEMILVEEIVRKLPDDVKGAEE